MEKLLIVTRAGAFEDYTIENLYEYMEAAGYLAVHLVTNDLNLPDIRIFNLDQLTLGEFTEIQKMVIDSISKVKP